MRTSAAQPDEYRVRACRREIEPVLGYSGLAECFLAKPAIDDVISAKPDPERFNIAGRGSTRPPGRSPIQSHETVAIENLTPGPERRGPPAFGSSHSADSANRVASDADDEVEGARLGPSQIGVGTPP